MSSDLLPAKALQLDIKAHRFYTVATEKVQACLEVSLALMRTATRQAADKECLEQLSH
jgi:hypothetical protein